MDKACGQCGQVKPLDGGFYRSKKYSDGRDIYCKECRDGRHAKWLASRPPQPEKPKPTEKQCGTCREVKPLAAFYVSSKGKRASRCKTCQTEYHREYVKRPEVAAKLKEQDRNRRSKTWKRPPRRQPIGPGFEVCTMCNLDKPLDQFYAHKLGRNGLDSVCKPCRAVRARERNKDPEVQGRVRDLKIQRVYRLRPGQYDEMLARQGGGCAICAAPPNGKHLHVDHNHTTGLVRGLLCHQCNSGLGQFKDSSALLQAAIQYLDRSAFRDVELVKVRAALERYQSTHPEP